MKSIARIMSGGAVVALLGVVAWPALSQPLTPVPAPVRLPGPVPVPLPGPVPVPPTPYHGAPGPIAGASLPVLAVGYGVYWLIRRRRKAN
jgi:hypothetical protein